MKDLFVPSNARKSITAIAIVCALALVSVGMAPVIEQSFGDVQHQAFAAAPKLSVKKKTINAGTTLKLKVKGSKGKVKWSSNNKKIATVSTKGVVKGKRAGSTTIIAKVGGNALKCKVTVKAALNKSNVTLFLGKSVTLKVMGLSGKAKWTSSNSKVATVSTKGKVVAKSVGSATIKAKVGKKTFKCKVAVVKENAPSTSNPSGSSTSSQYKVPATTSEKALVSSVSSYTYKVTPVNGKLNNIVFVETNNPDPMGFQLADESSKYLDKGKIALFKPLCRTYVDVQYSNTSTRRISNKGYLFYCSECTSDGGSLRLLANKGYYYEATSWGAMYNDGTNYDTGKSVSVIALEDRPDYLIRTYAAGKTKFFDKLDAVQAGLDSIALYPKSLLDTSKPNSSGGYPCLATSPYPELSLNSHIENMYARASDGLFLDSAYGFVLDSLGVPGMMGSVAKRIDSSCKVESGYTHAFVDITSGGQTGTYGGAGAGGSNPMYSKFVTWKFKFDGTDGGYGTNPSMATMKSARVSATGKSSDLAQEYLDQINNAALTKVMGQGTWIRCAREGYGSYISFCYIAPGPSGSASVVSDAWVDGRYVNNLECFVEGAKFSDHPKSDIVLSNVAYKKKNGTTVTGTVTYTYESDTDDWRATYYYTGNYSCMLSEIANLGTLSPNLVLTRSQVEELVADGTIGGKTNDYPATGYIFDGTSAPGTYKSDLLEGLVKS